MSTRRANRDGDPCPPWCAADHDRELIPGIHASPHVGEYIPLPGDAFLAARPCFTPPWDAPRVQVSTRAGSLIVEDPERLAVLVEQLAGDTAERHHDLAAAIRKAARAINGDDHDESDV